jgi:cell division FtsZ-interacting protein ZapD
MHHTEKEIVDIVSKQKADLERMFSKMTLRLMNRVKSADSLKELNELRRAYKICIECHSLDQEIVNTICNQINILEKKYGEN